MELKKNVCTNCGASVNCSDNASNLICPACGMTFSLQTGRDFAQKLDEMSKNGVEVDIMNLRRVLRNFIQKPALYEDARNAVREILRVLPDDYRAQFYHCFLNRKRLSADYRNFLVNGDISKASTLEIKEVAGCVVKNGEAASEEAARRFIFRISMTEAEKADLYAKLDSALAFELERIEWYAKVPRNVFVCHSSNDVAVATKVVKKLESEGFSCWVSTRNIPPDSPDYWQDIEDGINNCRIFLVISSKTARVKQDVLKEMDIAKKSSKPALEFNIDNSTNTIYFKNYFAGQWIPAFDNIDGRLPMLAERVYELSERIKKQEEELKTTQQNSNKNSQSQENSNNSQHNDSQYNNSQQNNSQQNNSQQNNSQNNGSEKRCATFGDAARAVGRAVNDTAVTVSTAVSNAVLQARLKAEQKNAQMKMKVQKIQGRARAEEAVAKSREKAEREYAEARESAERAKAKAREAAEWQSAQDREKAEWERRKILEREAELRRGIVRDAKALPKRMSSAAKTVSTLIIIACCLVNIPALSISIFGGIYLSVDTDTAFAIFLGLPFFVLAVMQLAYAFSKRNAYVYKKKNLASIISLTVFVILCAVSIIILQLNSGNNYAVNLFLSIFSVIYCCQVIIGIACIAFQPKRIVL